MDADEFQCFARMRDAEWDGDYLTAKVWCIHLLKLLTVDARPQSSGWMKLINDALDDLGRYMKKLKPHVDSGFDCPDY